MIASVRYLIYSTGMSHLKARLAGNQAVRSFLAEVGALYCGFIYNHHAGKGKAAWEASLQYFDYSCAYCGTRRENLPRNTTLTIEHLIECNQFQVGLHHPGNTIPACQVCNNSRHPKKAGEAVGWVEHLLGRCEDLGHKAAVRKKRQEKIAAYMKSGPFPYPVLAVAEIEFLKKNAAELYQEAMVLSVPRVRAFWNIARMRVHPEK